MTAHTSGIAVAALAMAATTVLATPDIASATAGRLAVTSATPPVGVAGQSFPVAFVVRNTASELFCGQFRVTTTWIAHNGSHHSRSIVGESLTGAFSGSMTIPGSALQRGTLKYAVSARQTCGLFDGISVYLGRSPTTGWQTTTVV